MTPTTTDDTTERVEGERGLTPDEMLELKMGIDNAMCYFRYMKRNKPAYFTGLEQSILDKLDRAYEIAASIKDATVKID
jgi:hypothetical protein